MKKFFFILFSFIIIFSFASCSKKENTISANEKISNYISNIENIDSYSDETIKALSVLCRTNISIINNLNKIKKNDKISKLVTETKNETFLSEKINNNIFYETNKEWSKQIKKSDLLKNLTDNNIYLTSITKINNVNENSIKTTSFNINEKNISFDKLNNIYNFKSDYITNIEIIDDSLIFKGKGIGRIFEGINLNESENLSSSGKTYTEILLNFDEKGTLIQ